MIDSIRIERFRGIREGELTALPRIAVLTGPNGCGKSTVLEAMLIAGSNDVGDAVGRVVMRRMEMRLGGKWLLYRGGAVGEPPKIELAWSDGEKRVVGLSRVRINNAASGGERSLPELGRFFNERVDVNVRQGNSGCNWQVEFGDVVNFLKSTQGSNTLPAVPDLRLLDPRPGAPRPPNHRVYTACRQRGGTDDSKRIIREIIPDLSDIEILTEEDNSPYLAVSYGDRSVPLPVSGDGTASVIRLALELSATGPGTMLIEEPEVHLHARSLFLTARLMLAAARRGTQVIMTTHSLELIDMLLAEATPDDVAHLEVLRLHLDAGVLNCSRVKGKDAMFARGEIAEDLR